MSIALDMAGLGLLAAALAVLVFAVGLPYWWALRHKGGRVDRMLLYLHRNQP